MSLAISSHARPSKARQSKLLALRVQNTAVVLTNTRLELGNGRMKLIFHPIINRHNPITYLSYLRAPRNARRGLTIRGGGSTRRRRAPPKHASRRPKRSLSRFSRGELKPTLGKCHAKLVGLSSTTPCLSFKRIRCRCEYISVCRQTRLWYLDCVRAPARRFTQGIGTRP